MVEYDRKAQENMKFAVLLLGLCCFHQASGEIHSLKYFYTASTEVPSFPEFVIVGQVDNVQFMQYNSNSQQVVPKQDWMDKVVEADPQYFQNQNQIGQGTQQSFKANIEVVKQRFNQTGGVHSLQLMYGCEVDDDGTSRGYFQYGYDGEDFLSLEKSTATWTAANLKAVITKHKLEASGAEGNYWKNYLETTCIEWTRKYVAYGKGVLERKDPPEVSLFQMSPSVMACHATGFYPEGIVITWKRDGEEMTDDVNVGETLPNADGTFQKRALVTVPPEERKKRRYTCEVAHKGGVPIVKTLTEEDGSSLGIIIGCVAAAFVCLIGVIVAIVMKKKKGYNKAEQSDTDSDASNPPRA